MATLRQPIRLGWRTCVLAGSALYTVQPQDLQTLNTVPGVVIIQLRAVASAPGKNLFCGAFGIPISMHVKNLGPRNTPGFNAS